ncbi:MAG: UDP-glucose/GDP-mannose dehydrogenase family protein [Deinococcus sp.]|nr:UDP-glucose/GDP-mannose dehydrogenase family protein [Deinococcus sp.]
MSTVSVIGAGYVGLVTAACLAELGHTVVGVEIDPRRLSALQRGAVPIHEPGLSELVARHHSTGRLSFTNAYTAAIPGSEFVFITVNTPSGPDGQADTGYVYAAVRSVLEHARPGLILVMKSTVPVGTADEIAQLIAYSRRRGIGVVSNPEFLRQGSAIQDFLQPDRVVIGASRPAAAAAVAQLFAGLAAPVVRCSRRSAELAKYAANAFLAARISFMNEVAAICEAVEADIEEVAQIVGSDRRIGPAYLRAGLGWGGSCFPKDVRALAATAASHGRRPAILEAVSEVNTRQRERAFEQLRAALGMLPHATVGVLGLAFKPDTDDLRDAPALDIINRLLGAGIAVRAHDPVAIPNARRVLPQVQYCHDAYEVAQGSDALLLATEWRDYLALDWRQIRTLMRGRLVLDGRNVLEGSLLSALGFTYLSFGRSSSLGVTAPLARPAASASSGLWTAKP